MLTRLLVIVALSFATSLSAHADVVGVYFHGQSGLTGESSAALMPGGESADLGATFGFRAGAHLLVFDAYYDRVELQRGGVARAVGGIRGTNQFWKLRLTGNAVGGYLWEQGAVLGEATSFADRSGPVARAGLALDYLVNDTVYVGLALEGEVFAISPATMISMDELHIGSDVTANIHAGFQLGR